MSTPIFTYCSDIAGNLNGSSEGPERIEYSDFFDKKLDVIWAGNVETLSPHHKLNAANEVARMCNELAELTRKSVSNGEQFITLGGDHTAAIGTWSGAAAGLPGKLGLIWIDAHLDSHTPESSHSKNIHGMPLATLLGYGDLRLTSILSNKPKLKPENVCVIGVRSFEPEEQALLNKLGVKIFYMSDINKESIKTILKNAIQHVSENTAGFGISIDIDAFDPSDAPGVSVPEPDGIHANEFLKALSKIPKEKCVGVEIVEFNPIYDQAHRTEKLVCDMIKTLTT